MIKLRLKYKKHGPIRFLGHLDVMRYVQKAIRRAEIDIKYSEGYSPHQILSFAQPLSVGSTTDGDYMDMTLNSMISVENVVASLQDNMNEGLDVICAKVLPEKCENAMTSVAACEYMISFRNGKEPSFDLKDTFERFMALDTIPAMKKTKNGEKEIDIRPLIFRGEITNDNKIHVLLSAGSASNLKASLFVSSLYRFAGEKEPEFAAVYNRIDTYLSGEDEDGPYVVPMITDVISDASFARTLGNEGKIHV